MSCKGSLLMAALLLVSLSCAATGFEFNDMQGKPQRLADYKGKWVLVDMYNSHRTDDKADKSVHISVIGVAMNSTPDSVKAFAKQMEISYPIVLGSDAIAAQIGRIDALPTSYLYDPSGKLVTFQVGMITREAIENYIRSKSKK
jgi:cytochrome oxidase Cu insertion factor (SCO1/SenC/PrrC family)